MSFTTRFQNIIFKEINAFIQQTFIKLIQSDSKDIYNVKNYLYFK